MALGPYAGKETGELALLRELLGRLDPGTILLTDRYFCSYFMIALLLLGQRDFVARLHHRRKTDYATAKSLGKGDWLVRWLRPTRPDWMDPEQYATMPESIEVRLVEFPVCEPGFRPRRISVVTTLTDVSEYPKDDIAALYRQRWLVELDIRAIKTTMGMDVVRAKTPSMVRREIWSCLLAYNLIRKSILQSAHHTGRSPRELSFAAALQMTAATWEVQAVLEVAGHLDADLGSRLALAHLTSLATLRVGHRPGHRRAAVVASSRGRSSAVRSPTSC
jgi:putative transposase